MPDIAGGKGVGDLGGVGCTRNGKRIHVFHMIPRICWRGLGRRIDPVVMLGACVSSGSF